MTKTIDLDCCLRVRDGVDLRDVEGTPVLLSVETGKYFGLEGVGIDIWRLMEEGISLHQVVDRLFQIYDVPLALCRKDVIEFAQKLLNTELVDVVQKRS